MPKIPVNTREACDSVAPSPLHPLPVPCDELVDARLEQLEAAPVVLVVRLPARKGEVVAMPTAEVAPPTG